MRPTLPESFPPLPEGTVYYGSGHSFRFPEKRTPAHYHCPYRPNSAWALNTGGYIGDHTHPDYHFAGKQSDEMDALNGWSDEAPFAETDREQHLLHHLANVQDLVNQPPHYKQGEIECIDAIRSALTPEEFRGYCKGNTLKYVWREKHKGQTQDLAKSEWYLKQLTRDT